MIHHFWKSIEQVAANPADRKFDNADAIRKISNAFA